MSWWAALVLLLFTPPPLRPAPPPGTGCRQQTVGGADCVLPFLYEGQLYTACTVRDSENGAAWCATQVDSRGEVVWGAWEDCREDCTKARTTLSTMIYFYHDSPAPTE